MQVEGEEEVAAARAAYLKRHPGAFWVSGFFLVEGSLSGQVLKLKCPVFEGISTV